MSTETQRALDYFESLGKKTLPQQYREAILTVFQTFPDQWFMIGNFHEALKISKAYAYKICEALVLARIVEKRTQGRIVYYKLKESRNSP